MTIAKPRVAVLGGGSFGTVIANLAAGNGCPTTQWLRDADLVEEMQARTKIPVISRVFSCMKVYSLVVI